MLLEKRTLKFLITVYKVTIGMFSQVFTKITQICHCDTFEKKNTDWLFQKLLSNFWSNKIYLIKFL